MPRHGELKRADASNSVGGTATFEGLLSANEQLALQLRDQLAALQTTLGAGSPAAFAPAAATAAGGQQDIIHSLIAKLKDPNSLDKLHELAVRRPH